MLPRSRLIQIAGTGLLILLALFLWWRGLLLQVPAAVINWSTESEVDTLGFHVYRATEPIGPYEQVTQELIPSSGDPFTGSSYTFTDPTVEAGRTYYYQLEELETSGALTRLDEIVTYESRAEPNWMVVALLLGALFLLWLLYPPPARERVPTAEPHP